MYVLSKKAVEWIIATQCGRAARVQQRTAVSGQTEGKQMHLKYDVRPEGGNRFSPGNTRLSFTQRSGETAEEPLRCAETAYEFQGFGVVRADSLRG